MNLYTANGEYLTREELDQEIDLMVNGSILRVKVLDEETHTEIRVFHEFAKYLNDINRGCFSDSDIEKCVRDYYVDYLQCKEKGLSFDKADYCINYAVEDLVIDGDEDDLAIASKVLALYGESLDDKWRIKRLENEVATLKAKVKVLESK